MIGGNVEFEIKQFLWCLNEAENNDKIWGYVDVQGKIYNFWGRRADLDADRGKKLSFKRWPGSYGDHACRKKAQSKIRPSGGKTPYKPIPVAKDADGNYPSIEAIYPNFVAHFKKQLMYARLTGTVLGEEV